MSITRVSRWGTVLLAASLSSKALAHHSTSAFDLDVVREFTGEIVRIQWRNPHVRMHIRVQDEDGNEQIWEMEAQDINSLNRAGVPRELVEIGQVVRIAASPSSRRDNRLLLTNLLLPDNRELLMHMSGRPRWNKEIIGDRQAVRGRPDEFEAPVGDIFRVWTTVHGPGTGPTTTAVCRALGSVTVLIRPRACTSVRPLNPAPLITRPW